MTTNIERKHLLLLPSYQKAVCDTLSKYAELKIKNSQNMIWVCTINNHGKYLLITLIDYGSPEINAFIVNVCVATSVFYDEAIKITKQVLSKVKITPKLVLQDGERLIEDSIVVIQSISRMIFTSLQDFDIYDQNYSKFYSCASVFKKAVREVPELTNLMIFNGSACEINGRRKDLQFNKDVFSPVLGKQLFKKIANHCQTIHKLKIIVNYLGTVFKALRLFWERESIEDDLELEQNAKTFIEVIFSSFFKN